jgi:hypothetical protein
MIISGTFIDEITYDIPSQNWSREDWAREFATMASVGIDTAVIIRCGLRDQAIYDSKTLKRWRSMMPVHEDLGMQFLDLAAENGIDLFWGTYDTSPEWWENTSKGHELIDIHRELMPEIWERFGSHPAFKGWYLTYEISHASSEHADLVYETGRIAKQISPHLPVMISPLITPPQDRGGDEAAALDAHRRNWDVIISRLRECVDIVAFQDGTAGKYEDILKYARVNAELARKYGLQSWTNVEAFDRELPLKFPPLDWRKLKTRLDIAGETGAEKIITFEFSHFLSPNSTNPAAHNLFRQYAQYADIPYEQYASNLLR